MTTSNPTSGNTQALPTLNECQHDAVLLEGMIRGIDMMTNEGAMFDAPRVSITMVALRMAEKLANDLDRVRS